MQIDHSHKKSEWEEEGWCLLDGVVPMDEVQRARESLPKLFPGIEELANCVDLDSDQMLKTQTDKFSSPKFPFGSSALNHLVLHDNIIDLAQEFLGLHDIRLYQAMLTAKYANRSPDDDQLLHMDYCNHTLVVPRSDIGYQHLELFMYLSDVSESAGTKMVSRRLTGDIPIERAYLNPLDYGHLYEAEVSACGPAGTVLAYRPDVYHRGVQMKVPGEVRYMLHVAYKPAHTDWLGYQTWPSAGESIEWHRFMQEANVRQLSVLGFPEPGNPYWNEETLKGVGARYPFLDMTPWREMLDVDVKR